MLLTGSIGISLVIFIELVFRISTPGVGGHQSGNSGTDKNCANRLLKNGIMPLRHKAAPGNHNRLHLCAPSCLCGFFGTPL